MMNFWQDSKFPGKVLMRRPGPYGEVQILEATAATLSLCAAASMEAGMSTAQPLRDNTTLKEFQAAHPGENVGPIFYRWCTLYQCTPRHAMTLELQARGQDVEVSASGPRQQRGHTFHPPSMGADDADEDAMTFHPGMKSHTFHPGSTMAEETEPDPLKRHAVPLVDDEANDEDDVAPQVSDGDLDAMHFPDGTTLAALRKAGIIRPGMSAQQLNARLKRVGIGLHARMEKELQAREAGWFAGQVPAGTVTMPGLLHGSLPSPNGDTLEERRQQTTVPAGRPVANLQARSEDPDQLRRALRHTNWEAMTPWRTPAPTGRSLSGHAETRCS
jgi:hypothetical protein